VGFSSRDLRLTEQQRHRLGVSLAIGCRGEYRESTRQLCRASCEPLLIPSATRQATLHRML
jgi:hypothetical protein